VWPKVILSDTLEMAHGLQIEDWDADGRLDVAVANGYLSHPNRRDS
jgi:hypothetical protein